MLLLSCSPILEIGMANCLSIMQALDHFLCTGSNGTKVSIHYNINTVEYWSLNLLMFIVVDTIETLEIVSEMSTIQGVSMFINKGGSTVS